MSRRAPSSFIALQQKREADSRRIITTENCLSHSSESMSSPKYLISNVLYRSADGHSDALCQALHVDGIELYPFYIGDVNQSVVDWNFSSYVSVSSQHFASPEGIKDETLPYDTTKGVVLR